MPKITPGPDPTFDAPRKVSVGLGDNPAMFDKPAPSSGVESFAPKDTGGRTSFGIDQGDQDRRKK